MNSNYIIRSIAVDITNKCNYRCLHCYNFSGEHKKRKDELSDEEFLKIFNEAANLQPDSICICGGEPLLKKELIYKICNNVKSISESTSLNMVTNGYYLTREVAKKLKASGINLVQISLDGATPLSHNWLRKNDKAFEKAISAIELLKENKVTVNVACTPTKKNFEEINEIIRICTKLGVNEIRFQPLMLMGRASTNLKEYQLTDFEYHKLSRLINKESERNKNIKLEWEDPIQHIENIQLCNKKDSFIDLSISAYGDIMVSPYIPVMVGNVKNKSINDYLQKGLMNIYLDPFIKKCASMISDWRYMNLHSINSLFPLLGCEENINYDLLDDTHKDKNKIMMIKQMEG